MLKNLSTLLLLSAVIFSFSFVFGTNTAFAGYSYQDMENPAFPPAGWSVQNTSGHDMSRTTYCSGYGTGSASIIVDFFDYSSGNFELISPTLPVTTANDSLVFDHAYCTATTQNDNLVIYTSSNNGSAWNLLITLNGGSSGPLVTATPRWSLFVPTSTQWATKGYLLPVGTNKVKFTANTAFGNSLYLDNIRIGSRYTNDVGVNSISDPKWGITTGSQIPKAWVRNFGTASQSFNVTMTISPGSYSNTLSVSNIAPGATQQLTFPSFNFATTGTYTISAHSSLGSDQNTSNDEITNTVIVTPAPRKVVLEFCTGTWCQWCPCGDNEAHNLATAYPDNVIVLAYHGGSDPYQGFNGSNIIGLLGLSGYPSGLVDRRLGQYTGWGSFYYDGEYRLYTSPSATVNLVPTNVNYNQSTRELSVNMNATALTTLSGQYKVNYVITEDNLIYNQTGNSWCIGSPTWVHHWVVRNMVNGASGTNVNSGTWNNGQTYPLTFTTTLNAGWVAYNCKFEVFIYKDNGALSVSEIQGGYEDNDYIISGINKNQRDVPGSYELEQNYPNPFNPTTNVHFSIPKDGNVSFKVYNSLGQLVETYLDGFVKAGYYNAEIDGSGWSSGIYFYTLSAGEFVHTKKMILVK